MLKDENTRLRVLAEHDWLTGLYNRRAAEAHVDEALLKNGGGMLLVLDIDHFKQVNDRYGCKHSCRMRNPEREVGKSCFFLQIAS